MTFMASRRGMTRFHNPRKMNENDQIFNASLAIFLLMISGCVLRRFRWLPQEADATLLNLSVNFLYPCLILSKTFTSDLSAHLRTLWIYPLSGFLVVILGILVAWLFARLPMLITGLHDKRQQRTFIACIAVFNYGFLPIPLVMDVYKDSPELLTLLMIFNLGVEFALWTCVVPQLVGGLEKDWWKHLLRIPLLAVIVALIGNVLGAGAYIPVPVMKAMTYLGNAQIPVSLIMIGAIIYDELMQRAHITRKRDATKIVFGTLLLRAAVLPASMITIACCLPQYPWLQKILVIQAGMPCAMMSIMFSRIYNGAPSVAVRSVLSSSVTSLATVVFWISFGMWAIG